MKISVPLTFALALIIAEKTQAFSSTPPFPRAGYLSYSSTRTVAIYMAGDESAEGKGQKKRQKIMATVSKLTNRIVKKPIPAVAPKAILELITDATKGSMDLALEEVSRVGGGMRQTLTYSDIIEKEAAMEGDTARALDTIALAKTTAADAFALAESAIEEAEEALKKSKLALTQCRENVAKAIAIAEKSAYQANIASQKATVLAATAVITASGTSVQAPKKVEVAKDISTELEDDKAETIEELANEQETEDLFDVSSLSYEDVDYHMSEMQPPFIGEDQCLVPGEAVVRVEKATDNSRRIFAGIDIMASVDDVWNVSV